MLGRPNRRAAGLLALEEHELIAAVGGHGAAGASAFVDTFDHRVALDALSRAGVGAVCGHSGAYPSSLTTLDDPPAVLYCAGRADRFEDLTAGPAATVIGARRASPYALEVSYELGRGLGAAGVSVVSGLALGVDAAAHRGALDAGGKTIAVLASGVDVPYPRTNRALLDRLRGHGLVLSELPPGQRALKWSFPARNRIMAGLSSITVIVEAAEGSGSLITASFAQELGRDVAAVPGRVTSRMAAGTNRLLREGAPVIRGPEDLLDEIFGPGEGAARAGGEARPPSVAPALATLEPGVRSVLDAVEAGEGAEAIGAARGLSAGDVRAALGRLELLGLIHRDALGGYERTLGG